MKGPDTLIRREDNWITSMGQVFAGERVVIRGHDLFRDLSGMRWMELYMFLVTGKRFSQNQILLFESMWTLCTSYPDPRIWNNRIAALAGTARSTCTLAVSAATAVSEARIYGRQPDIRAIDFLYRLQAQISAGTSLCDSIQQELDRYRGLPGFSRPMARSDERLGPLSQRASELGLDNGPYVQLLSDVQHYLKEQRYRLNMNVAALGAALAADQGLTPYEYCLFLTPAFTGGMIPCYIEARSADEGAFLPMSCARIEYTGPAIRAW